MAVEKAVLAVRGADPPVDPTARDRTVSIAKGLVGALPFAGAILAEVIGQIIPEQRWERLREYLAELDSRLRDVEEGALADKLRDPRKIDLFEDGVFQAARALSSERLRHIATLVAGGLTSEEQGEIEAKRLLGLLGQVDDDQIIILQSKLYRHVRSAEFRDRHKTVLESVGVHMQSSREELDRDEMYRLARSHLVDLGLLKATFRKPKRGEAPEFDEKTGMMKAKGLELSPLGRLLLRRVGVAEEDEFQ